MYANRLGFSLGQINDDLGHLRVDTFGARMDSGHGAHSEKVGMLAIYEYSEKDKLFNKFHRPDL
ncbi:hypothetical protein DESC_730001 [Desulfosarcina cetonica]|nr:hypothetical protein DESC_730001 [Desulfosarcina cetonica]